MMRTSVLIRKRKLPPVEFELQSYDPMLPPECSFVEDPYTGAFVDYRWVSTRMITCAFCGRRFYLGYDKPGGKTRYSCPHCGAVFIPLAHRFVLKRPLENKKGVPRHVSKSSVR